MELELRRSPSDSESTAGELWLAGSFECYTLEDIVRPAGRKVAGATAIPAGRYEVDITFSPRFGQPMPLLLAVPDFEGVRIHWGNTAADTEGCILVGQTRGKDFIGSSRAAFEALFPKLRAARAVGKIFIRILDAEDSQRNGEGPGKEGQAEEQSVCHRNENAAGSGEPQAGHDRGNG